MTRRKASARIQCLDPPIDLDGENIVTFTGKKRPKRFQTWGDAMNDSQRVTMAQTVRTLRENLPAMLEYAKLSAQLARAKYLALIEQGFTDAQALDLCARLP